MTKDIKDFLPLYLGQKVKGEGTMIFTLSGITLDCNNKAHYFLIDSLGNACEGFKFKLLLRPLSSMTGEEAKNLDFSIRPSGTNYSPESFKYLLSKGFDLFNLIPEGLALDTTTLKN